MSIEVVSDNLRDALRRETAPLHALLEQRVNAAGYFNTPQAYLRWLCVMQTLHARFAEDYDAGSRRLGLAPLSAPLAAALAQDIGANPASSASCPLSCTDLRGVAYVFEGSAVGARLLLRNLAALDPVPNNYLRTLVAASARRWPRVKAQCARIELGGPAETHGAVTAARSVFEAFLEAFAGDAA